MFFHNTFGIDLGSSSIKLYSRRNDRLLKEMNMIAVLNREEVLAVGNAAYEMYEKSPEEISVGSPMVRGKIADIEKAEFILQMMLKKMVHIIGRRPTLYFAVPTAMSEIERRAYHSIAHRDSLKKSTVYLVEKPIADAIAMGVPLSRTKGVMLINIGAEYTEMSVLADNRLIISKNIPIGGQSFNEAICDNIRKRSNFIVGNRTAKRLKHAVGNLDTHLREGRRIIGIECVSGLPRDGVIPSAVVNEALQRQVQLICKEIRIFLERTPPQVHKSILAEGIYICGGSSQLKNLDTFLSGQLGCTIKVSQFYDMSTVQGLRELINHKALHHWAVKIKKKK